MSSLRGSVGDFDVHVVADEVPQILSRVLHITSNATSKQPNINGGNRSDNSAFMIFVMVIVSLVVLFYIVCMLHMVRLWCIKRGIVDEPAQSLVVSGRVFDLTPGQRRGVLEAIFSESSKAVNEADVDEQKEKRKKRNNSDKSSQSLDGDVPVDAEVPVLKDVLEGEPPRPFHDSEGQELPGTFLRSIPLPHPSTNDDNHKGRVEESIEEEKSEDEEDTKLKNPSISLLSEPIIISRVDSIGSAETCTFDDNAEDNVCPICLGSFQEGNTLIASKHCSHLFHKDCVLEWLEKHDSCPVCRVDMITQGEINHAAKNIVGSTRMYVAVQSMRRNPQTARNSETQQRHVLPAHRRVIAEPRTPSPSLPRHQHSECTLR